MKTGSEVERDRFDHEEKRRAEDMVDSVSGVTDVSNQLRVAQSVPITSEPDTDLPPRGRTAGA